MNFIWFRHVFQWPIVNALRKADSGVKGTTERRQSKTAWNKQMVDESRLAGLRMENAGQGVKHKKRALGRGCCK